MSNKMKVFDIKDIHSGYVVKFRNGKLALCMRVGRNFTKIFACVDEESQKIGAKEGTTFVYTSSYYPSNYYRDWNRVTNRPFHNPEFDVVAVYGLIDGVRNYLHVGCTDPVGSLDTRPLLWEEEIKEMTLEEIEKKLGHRVKVVPSDPTTKYYQIKSDDLCDSCKYGNGHSGCLGVACDDCKVRQSAPRCGSSCPCNMVPDGAPCPYYEENK